VVADAHALINRHLDQRRQEQVSFFVSTDGIHPNQTGHWLMAQALLEAWHAPAEAGSIDIEISPPCGTRVSSAAALLA